MPYCPNCYTEYENGVLECTDCKLPLMEGTPEFCPYCEQPVEEDDTFCENCGRLLPLPLEANYPECETHVERAAIGGCIICGRPVCDECAHEVEGRIFCEDDSHRRVYEGFVHVYTTSTDYEAEMIRANLQGADIDAFIFNQHDHIYFVNMGTLAQVKIMVPKHQVEKAEEIIASLMAGDGLEANDDEQQTGADA